MKYRLQVCVVAIGETVELPAFPTIVSVRQITCSDSSTGGVWKNKIEIQYLKLEEQTKPKRANKAKG